MNILLVKLDGIGDAVLAVPALRALRAAYPQADLTLVVRSPVDDLLKHAGLADRIIRAGFRQESCDTRKGWPSYLAKSVHNAVEARRFYKKHLAMRHYDLALNLRLDRDSYGGGFLVWHSGALQRLGVWEKATLAKATGNRFHDLFYTKAVPIHVTKHEVESNLLLAEAAGAFSADRTLRFEVSREDREKAAGILPLEERSRTVIVGIGATQPKRQWPLARYRSLIELLVRDDCRCVLVGSEADGHAASAEMGEMPEVRNLCGRLGLREVYALMDGCRLFVGNDSGPMHLAAATGVPVLEISSYPRSAPEYGSNCPLRFGPWGVPHRVLQPEEPKTPCQGQCRAGEPHCITQIRLEDVWEQARSLMMAVPA